MRSVAFDGVSKVYPGGAQAVTGIDLEVAPGELVALLGPSGSGKTTLLRLVAGLERPTEGVIRIGGESVGPLPPHRRGVGLVSQRAVLYPHLSVRDNLRFGLRRRAWWSRSLPAGVQEQVDRVTYLLGIADLLDRRPGELSGGEQQRVALGRALVRQPQVLLLDEPFASLDGPLRWELRRQLHLLQRRLGATMMLVTHEQDEALALADRIAVLDRGRLVQVGAPTEILDCPASPFVARLVGWPPINLLPGQLLDTEAKLVLEGGASLPALPGWADLVGHRVLLGLRPIHVRVPAGISIPGEVVIQATLSDVQPGQAAGHVAIQWGGISLLGVRAGPTFEAVSGAIVTVALDLPAAFLFDVLTGRAHRAGPR